MIFRSELVQAVMDGRKTVTRRLVREDNPRSPWHPDNAPKLVGKRVAVCPGRGKQRIGEVTVASVTYETFWPRYIGEDEAQREGFRTVDEFLATWERLHGSLDATYDVWRIELADPAPAGREENP